MNEDEDGKTYGDGGGGGNGGDGGNRAGRDRAAGDGRDPGAEPVYGNPAEERSLGSVSDVTTEGVFGRRPGRAALVGGRDLRPGHEGDGDRGGAGDRGDRKARHRGKGGKGGSGGKGEQRMVPEAEFRSYYGKPVLNPPSWSPWDIGGYFFLGGLAGAGSVLAAGAEFTGRPAMARSLKLSSAAAITGSLVALVHDLGRPGRFVNMLRVFKPTSPMSVGSWLLSAYGPLVGAAAASELTGLLPRAGRTATVGAALMGPAVAAYTAVLAADTAVPAWHDGHRELPFVFVGSATMAASGMALATSSLATSPLAGLGPARSTALAGAALENAAAAAMRRRLGVVAETYRSGTAGRWTRAAETLCAAGVLGTAAGACLDRWGRRSFSRGSARTARALSAASGTALLAASACTRLSVFHAGLQSAKDPKYTVVPQRERLRARNGDADPDTTADTSRSGNGNGRNGAP